MGRRSLIPRISEVGLLPAFRRRPSAVDDRIPGEPAVPRRLAGDGRLTVAGRALRSAGARASMTRKAYSFVRTFAPEPARELCVDRHYLLCASAGALRLEAQGQA